MAFADEAQLLGDYVQWQAAKKVAGIDTTPAAFLVEKAQEAAFSKVLDAIEYLQAVGEGASVTHVVNTTLKILET